MKLNPERIKRIGRGLAILLFVFVVGGIGGVYFDQRVLPMIRTNRFLSHFEFLQRASENVTVINKTEQVTIKEDDSINEVASQASNAVVNIISISSQKDSFSRTAKEIDQNGTGVIVTSDGMIATYRSAIIEQNATYEVLLYDGSHYDAKLLGVDEFTNLAYLKIDAPNLTAISFADSSSAIVGKKVVAIGNGLGQYRNRYAAGLLSNIDKTFNLGGKTVSSSEKLEGVFESDFNGSSDYVGGPIIGYSGDMLGIIGKITINNVDQYFEIPSNAVQQSMQVALGGKFDSRPVLGAYYIPVTKEYALVHGLNMQNGAMIYAPSGQQGLAILSGSAAQIAGLQINDIVTKVNDQEVNLDNPLSDLLSQHAKGETVTLTISRAGKEMALPVKL
ncbi:MAG TPA: S1C family serine protease [Patescibacteria group bacterium]